MSGYHEFQTPKPDFMIDALWIQDTPLSVPIGGNHLLVPEPTVNIILSRYRDALGNIYGEKVELSGPITKPCDFKLIPGHTMIAARIKAEWLVYFLNISAQDITDHIIDLSLISTTLNDQLLSLFNSDLSNVQIISSLYRTLKSFAAANMFNHHASEYGVCAIEIIRRCGGTVSQKKLSKHLNVSDRQLRRTVRNMIGMTPKAFSRNIRFLKTLEHADKSKVIDWSDLAANFGYFDQAHLIKEFNQFAKMAPNQLMTLRQEESVFSNPV